MKIYKLIILGILLFFGTLPTVTAQEVNIVVPAYNIFSRTEFTTVQYVLYSRYRDWITYRRGRVLDPTFKSTSGSSFRNRSNYWQTLSSQVLQFRVASIGGEDAPFYYYDYWPGFKSFTTSEQTWYEPSSWGDHRTGNTYFTFKILASEFANQAMQPGDYSMEITHNYYWYFTPETFEVVISIPKAISWLTANNSIYTQISSLNDFRYAPSNIEANLGNFQLGNTLNFNLLAKSASSTIQFTSSKGVQGTRNIAILKLGSSHPKIASLSLSNSWKDFTAGNSFYVEYGNRNEFNLALSVSQSDFKTYFYEAGTYKFQLNLNAKSTDNTTASAQNIDFTVNVLPLSEITVPNSGNAVNFEFNTIAQYQNGQSKTIANQLKISNNETYELNVRTDASFFKRSGIQSDVPSSILQVGIEGSSQQVALSTTSQKIINNGSPVLDKNLNIKYTISANAAQTLVAKEKSTYSINVIYSFTAL